MTKARDLANLISGGFTEADIPNLSASKITSGTFADARLSASSVQQYASTFDDNKIVNDISTLGLRVHTQENLNASNTNSASFDVFQDSSGITNLTNTSRSTEEYVGSIVTSTVAADAGGTLTDITASNTYWSSGSNNDNYGDGNDIGIDGSYDYSYWSTSALLTGNFRHEVNGTTTTTSTNTSSDNRLEFGINGNAGSGTDGAAGNAQENNNLTDNSSSSHSNTVPNIFASTGGYGQSIILRKKNSGNAFVNIATITDSWATDAQLSFARSGSTLYFMIDGVIKHTFASSDFNTSGNLYFTYGFGVGSPTNWLNCKYRSGMSAVKGIPTTTANATGSFEGNAITASSSTNKMGAVLTYQDNAGVNALNTDIILKLSADNGSNYSTATLTALPDFATGIKMAKVNDLSVTAGTQLKYKIEFANQASSSKEARIRGVSLQY